MAVHRARWMPGKNVPGFALTAVLGGRFVKITADKTTSGDYTIGQCVLGDRAFGVAEYDSGPTTQDIHSVERRVNVVRRGAIARVEPGTALAFGVDVMSDANGKAVIWDANAAHVILGRTCHACAGTDAFVEIDLY